MINNPRQLSGKRLADALRASRARTWSLVDDLSDAQWLPPQQRGVNPIAWELAHLAWFAEFWILRGPHGRDAKGFAQAALSPQFVGPDAIFDSAQFTHGQRWVEKMPTRAQLRDMMANQLEACIAAIPNEKNFRSSKEHDEACYFHRLALFHEDMHGEAFCWLRAALAYSAPAHITIPTVAVNKRLTVLGGADGFGFKDSDKGFAFDNELPAYSAAMNDFEIDSAPVSARQFAQFVDAAGYDNAHFWPGQAGAWRTQSGLHHPQRWRRNQAGEWEMRWFDQWVLLAADTPIIHVNAFEAQAYCLWAKRRLPNAREWEFAARSCGEFQWGQSVWEWTADAFNGYPGFEPGPYQEYSKPWFGNHRELRGGAFATDARMHDVRYRNFFEPHRNDVFAGFRTVAL
jgi:gamma-glutamyl hercynylcysteine S-oxide synthase